MTDVWLGVIAVAVSAMAVSQVALAVAGIRAAKQLQALAGRLEKDVKPLIGQVQTIAADVARTSALAAAQIERVDTMTLRLWGLVDEATALGQGILAPWRGGLALVRGLLAAFGGRGRERPPRQTSARRQAAEPGPPPAKPGDDDVPD